MGHRSPRKLARRFVASPTPEAYTSKTCCRCLLPCGPWEEKEAAMGKKIRGLRRCTASLAAAGDPRGAACKS